MSIESQHAKVPVTIAIAMSEGGRFMVAVANSNWIQEEQKHQQMLNEIRADRQLWSLRYIKTAIPYPVSNEDQP